MSKARAKQLKILDGESYAPIQELSFNLHYDPAGFYEQAGIEFFLPCDHEKLEFFTEALSSRSLFNIEVSLDETKRRAKAMVKEISYEQECFTEESAIKKVKIILAIMIQH